MASLSPPVYRSSVFKLSDSVSGAAIHEGRQPGYFYGRLGNPTQALLERTLCDLEGGEAALALASGMAAIAVALFSAVRPGDHVIAPMSMYATTSELLDDLLGPFGVETTYVDATSTSGYHTALRENTRLLFLESPSNPTLHLTDLASVAALARARGLVTVVDNTLATPVNQLPLRLGVDVVVHSATKYLGGHGDAMGGILVGSKAFIEKARWHTNKTIGGVISPDAAWLVLRGIRTLALRVERHNSNALRVAQFLSRHPKVVAVGYPGLPTHPQHSLAASQMNGCGGIVAFDVGSAAKARGLIDSVRLCTLAVSFGDVATLIQHSGSMTHGAVSRQRREAAGITEGLIRLSVGIEDVKDIIDDLDRALALI